MVKFLRNYSLSIALFILFFVSWMGQAAFQWQEFVNTQKEHKAPVQTGEFLSAFGASTMENWQSEFLQLFTFVVLTTFLIHKGSHESKDSDEEMKASLSRIEKQLKALKPKK